MADVKRKKKQELLIESDFGKIFLLNFWKVMFVILMVCVSSGFNLFLTGHQKESAVISSFRFNFGSFLYLIGEEENIQIPTLRRNNVETRPSQNSSASDAE